MNGGEHSLPGLAIQNAPIAADPALEVRLRGWAALGGLCTADAVGSHGCGSPNIHS